jgi:hypothetical protein
MNKTIILNAPPNAGKDTIAIALAAATGALHMEMKEHLYHVTASLFNVNRVMFENMTTDRERKERQTQLLTLPMDRYNQLCRITGSKPVRGVSPNSVHAISPREALIYTSELVIKPAQGRDYFGKIANSNIQPCGAVFSDGGFDDELTPILLGQEDVYIIKFDREGCSWEGDSRSWLTPRSGVPELVTTNNGTVKYLVDEILEFIGE